MSESYNNKSSSTRVNRVSETELAECSGESEVGGICPPLSDKYTVERELGKGGGGCVYLAQDELGRQVALKHRKALTSDDQYQVERLIQEARTVASLRHPNVAVVYTTESYPKSGDYCVVMEYADGGTLADLLEAEGHLSLEKALEIGIEICTALEYVHRQGLVHGDIKPSNILFFRTDDRIDTKVADFGLSQSVLVGDQQPDGRQGAFTGTLEYAAPELLGGETVDKRADLYSLGAVLYHMLVGKPPFPFSGDIAAVIEGHVRGDLTLPQELRPAVFDELGEVILRALAKLPSERFQDGRTMLAALRDARRLCTQYHNQAESLYHQGMGFEEQKKWSDAVKSFKQAYALNPELKDVEQRLENARLQLELETTWHEMENLFVQEAWADALEQLGRIARLDRGYRAEQVSKKIGHARLQLDLASQYGDARAAEGAGRGREAIRLYVGIVSKDDSYRDAAQRLARLRTEEDLEKLWKKGERLVQNEEWEESIRTYEHMLGKDPGHAGAALKLDYARRKLELAQLYDQALSELEKESWDEAIRILRDITRREPGYKDAAIRLARVSRRQQLTQLRQSVKQAIEAHQWSEAEMSLEELLRLEPGDEEAQQRREYVQQCQKFENLYEQGKIDYGAHQWDEAISKFEEALRVADAARLDLHNYLDIRSLMDQAKTNEQIDALYENARQYEAADDFPALVRMLDRILALDQGNQQALQWKNQALQQMRLENLYSQASSRMEQRDWVGAKRLLDEIASVDAQFENVQAMRTQVALSQGVNLGRRWGCSLAILLGTVLLFVFAPSLITAARRRVDLGSLVVTPGFVGAMISLCALVVSIAGRLIPAERLYGLLEKDKRLRVCVILATLLVMACLLMAMRIAFVPEKPAPDPDNLCNGSFDDGYYCWEKEGNLNQEIQCEAGQCFAVLGDQSYSCEDGVPIGEASIRQSFKVPDTVSPTLSLRYRVFSYDILTSNLDESDFFQVSINRKPIGHFGNTEWDKSDCKRRAWDSSWQSEEFDLSSYRGERVELSLRNVNKTNEWWNTWTYVDDVETH